MSMTTLRYPASAVELRPAADVRPGEQIMTRRGAARVLKVEYSAPYTRFLAPVPEQWAAHRIVTVLDEYWAGPGSLVTVVRPKKAAVPLAAA